PLRMPSRHPSVHLPRLFFFTAAPPPYISTLSLHDALPICLPDAKHIVGKVAVAVAPSNPNTVYAPEVPAVIAAVQRRVAVLHERSEEHTSELQSRSDLVCRLLLEKKKNDNETNTEQATPSL